MSDHEMHVHGKRAECTCGWWISDLTNAWAVSSAAAHVDAFVEQEMVEVDPSTNSPQSPPACPRRPNSHPPDRHT